MIFLFIGSSLARLEPKLKLFEVWDDGDDELSHHYLQTALARVLDELESNQKKENHLNTISKMMGTLLLVHVQLYTFSYRKAVIQPQNVPKTADWG